MNTLCLFTISKLLFQLKFWDRKRKEEKQMTAFLLPVSDLNFSLFSTCHPSWHREDMSERTLPRVLYCCLWATGRCYHFNHSGMCIASWIRPAPWKSWVKSQKRNVIAQMEIDGLGLFFTLSDSTATQGMNQSGKTAQPLWTHSLFYKP